MMKHEKMLSRAFYSIAAVVMTAVLITAGCLLFRTFGKSAEADIFRYTRELEASVRHTAAAEYRRFMLLIDVGKSIGNIDGEEELRVRLAGLRELFGSESEMPNLALSAGYYDLKSPEKAFGFDFSTVSWREIDNLFNKKRIGRGRNYFYTGFDDREGSLYLAVENPENQRAVFFRLDLTGFIENYVKETIISTNEEFVLEWIRIEDFESRRHFEEEYRDTLEQWDFRPLRVLMGRLSERRPLIVEIPGFFDSRRFIESDDMEEDAGRGVNPEPPQFINSGVFLKMSRESGSYYHDIEYMAAVNFFETVVVFIVIGILFLLLLFQLQRTMILRSKEKEFVASITHELRTPLTVIRSAADNLVTGVVPEAKLPVYGNLIISQSERLGNMIEEILLYSKFEDKKMKPDLAVEMDLQEIISGLKQSLEALSSANGIRLRWDTKGLPETAYGYPEIINLAVNNLVTNAVNHAYTEGSGEIRIVLRALIPGRMEIAVEDDGRGIDPRELKQVFDPFYRDSASRQRQEKGSGLGLFIVRRKALLAGGRLTVESPYRRIDGRKMSGCRFVLTLPLETETTDG